MESAIETKEAPMVNTWGKARMCRVVEYCLTAKSNAILFRDVCSQRKEPCNKYTTEAPDPFEELIG